MVLKAKIPANTVEKGMFVVSLDRPWTEVPLLFQRFSVKTAHEINTLRKYCKYVVIEVEKQYWEENKARITGIYPNKPLIESTDLSNELPRAYDIYTNAVQETEGFFEEAALMGSVDVEGCKKVVKDCVSSILSNPNALFWLTRIKHIDNFTTEHSLRVSILAIALGYFIGMKKEDVEVLGMGGMMHDIGKSQVPSAILNKNGEWTEAERRIMQRHASLGHDLINFDTNLDPRIKDMVHNHHKRIDSKGYPHQIPGESISVYAKIISIIDAYDTITSDTSYRKARSPRDAMKVLFDERDKQFDKNLVQAFIKMVGIYPPGSFVRMSNGETAIVVSNNPNNKLNPKVELIQHKQGRLLLDLSKMPTDESGATYSIKASLADHEVDLDVRQYVLDSLREQSDQNIQTMAG